MLKPARTLLSYRIKRSGKARYLVSLRRFRVAKKRVVFGFTLWVLKARFWVQIRLRNALIFGSNWIARRCHIAARRAREVYALRIFKPPRRPHATWSSLRRVARGVI